MIYPTTKEDRWGESLYLILEEHFPKIPYTRISTRGYVYLLAYELTPKLYKIGISNHPWKRIRDLRAQFPLDVDVLAIGCFANNAAVERVIFKQLENAGKWRKGEWFELDDEDVERLTKAIEDGDQSILVRTLLVQARMKRDAQRRTA